MQATADHLSLETCKLLKDCGVESEYWYILHKDGKKCWDIVDRESVGPNEWTDFCSAYTWSDVLWKHADKFFGSSFVRLGRSILDEASLIVPCYILRCLKEGDYERADQMFKDKCILIPQSTNE